MPPDDTRGISEVVPLLYGGNGDEVEDGTITLVVLLQIEAGIATRLDPVVA